MAIKVIRRGGDRVRKNFTLSSTAWNNLTALSMVLDRDTSHIINTLLEEPDIKKLKEIIIESMENKEKELGS